MKEFLKKLALLLSNAWLWSLFVVLAAVLLIWFLGPVVAVADNRIWETPASRVLTISIVVLLWCLFLAIARWRQSIKGKDPVTAAVDKERIDAAQRMDECREVRGRFDDALRTLKSSSLYLGRSERWRNELPWYLLMGPAGAGKTSLLDFSGLEFPLNKIERKLTRDTQGTQCCDWYFASNAVLIDTAGRYLSQPDDVSKSGWETLLGQLRRRRRARPLNGILITLDVDTLKGDESLLEALARQVRDRLNEIQQRLNVDVPVYLMLSKVDRVEGFDAFFDQLGREESEQVLGVSFRKDQKGTDALILREEFDALLQRLNTQVIARIHVERDIGRRGLILEFPDKLSLLGDRLCLFVDMAFTGSRYQRSSHLRGFYLTSAPYLTEQVEKTAAAIGAHTGIASKVMPTLRKGRARFIHQLLSRVIFPEAELASLDKRETRRIQWRHRALYGGSLAVLGTFALAWADSFSANHERLETVRELSSRLSQEHARLRPEDDERVALKALDTSFTASQVFSPDQAGKWHEHTGLYQGQRSWPALDQAYVHELQTQLLPRVAAALENQIRANLNDRERLLGSLRSYLMLNLQERRDPVWLKQWLSAYWSERYNGDAAAQQDLHDHWQRLLDRPFLYSLDDALVAQARQVLRGDSLASVVYRSLREQASSLPEYRLSQHLGPQVGILSGADYVIPGFYTQRGYQQSFIVKGAGLVQGILRDNWILGEGGDISEMDLRRLMVELEQLYFRDYANHWSEAVASVGLQSFAFAADGAEQMASLTAASSPLLQLLVEVRDNTRFQSLTEEVQAPTPTLADSTSALGAVAAAAAQKAARALADAAPDTAKKSLQRRFEPLHRLLDKDNGPASDLLPVLQVLNELQLQVAGLARSSQQEQGAYEWAKARMNGQRDALSSLRNASTRLPQPVNRWLTAVADDTWSLVLAGAYRHINQRYQSELYSVYSTAIDKRYPFTAHGTSDVALNDFQEFFKVQGLVERFFESYVRPFTSGDADSYRLRSVDGRSLPMSRVFLEQMAHARIIRQGFFTQNPGQAQVQFKLEPYTLDPGVSRAEFRLGNQTLEYRHGPIMSMSFKWPAEADDGRSSLVMEKTAGRALGLEENTGPWSLFRLFDLMQTEYLRGRDVLVLKANVGGLRANYLLSSQRSPNPFDMTAIRRFRLPGQL
jgi:type VI secretion system protein ImpL